MRGRPVEVQAGKELARYGSFGLRELWQIWSDGSRVRKGEIVLHLRATPSAPDAVSVMSVAYPVGLHRTDVAFVLRWVRIWRNYRMVAIQARQDALRDVERDMMRRAANEANDTLEETLEALQRDAGNLRADIKTMQHEYDLVEAARLELEAQHPELDLEPVEETVNPDTGRYQPTITPPSWEHQEP